MRWTLPPGPVSDSVQPEGNNRPTPAEVPAFCAAATVGAQFDPLCSPTRAAAGSSSRRSSPSSGVGEAEGNCSGEPNSPQQHTKEAAILPRTRMHRSDGPSDGSNRRKRVPYGLFQKWEGKKGRV